MNLSCVLERIGVGLIIPLVLEVGQDYLELRRIVVLKKKMRVNKVVAVAKCLKQKFHWVFA